MCFAQGNEAYYYKSSDCIFHMAKRDNVLTLIDEVDKIEVVLPFDKKSELQTLLMRFIAKKERQVWQKTIEQILGDEFKIGKYDQILGKPYLVYDIETTVADDIRSAKFIIAYAASPEPVAEGDTNMKYECVMIEDLKDFVDKMLAFDGYIVGFNQIWFDNPVSLWNAGYGEKEIEILNWKRHWNQEPRLRCSGMSIKRILKKIKKVLKNCKNIVKTMWEWLQWWCSISFIIRRLL